MDLSPKLTGETSAAGNPVFAGKYTVPGVAPPPLRDYDAILSEHAAELARPASEDPRAGRDYRDDVRQVVLAIVSGARYETAPKVVQRAAAIVDAIGALKEPEGWRSSW